MKVALLTTDNREHHRRYNLPAPYFGPAIEALLQGLATRSELEIHVVSCTQRQMPAPEKLFPNTFFHLLHVPKIGWLRTAYQGCIRAIRRKLQQLQPEIVHGQGTERECALAAVFSGLPNVITLHGNMHLIAPVVGARFGSYWWFAARLEQLALARAGGVLCNSRHTQSSTVRYNRRTWLVPNAIRREFFDLPRKARPPTARPILLNIGTISPLKRQVELLELAKAWSRAGCNFELRFIGDRASSDEYAEVVSRELDRVEAAGFARLLTTQSLPQLVNSMDSATALIHVPSEEAFGLVVAEALARNLKLFATNTGGIPDIAANVEGAELFALSNQRELGDAVASWLRAGCPQPPSSAKKMEERYHPKVIAQRHVEIYDGVLANRSR